MVSVLMPILNAAKFIEEAIESVFAQTHDNWELLLVDDGSTDGSTDIALRYAKRCPERVRYLEHAGHQNRGASATRNLGIRHAKGEYIAFLDADDVWLPHKLEQQVAILVSHPDAAMAYGTIQVWYSWTGKSEDSQRDFVIPYDVPVNTLYRPPTLLTLQLQGKRAWPFTPNIVVRRRMLKRTGGFEEAFPRLNELFFSAKILLEAPVFVMAECLSRWRQHDTGLSIAPPAELRSAELSYLNWLEAYLVRQGIKDAELWKALRKALWPCRHPAWYRALDAAHLLMKQLHWLARRIHISVIRIWRRVLHMGTGSIRAHPNPTQVPDRESRLDSRIGETTLSWASRGTEAVEVHVDAPDGPVVSRSGPAGSATTGLWVTDGMVFYLQDVSGGLPLTLANTLAVTRLKVTVAREADAPAPHRVATRR